MCDLELRKKIKLEFFLCVCVFFLLSSCIVATHVYAHLTRYKAVCVVEETKKKQKLTQKRRKKKLSRNIKKN